VSTKKGEKNGTKENCEFKPTAYARLSKYDKRGDKLIDKSQSIENQIDLIDDYCRTNGFPPPKVFYDDDTSGTSFQRDDCQRLYAATKAREIDTVIVKYTDRVGRNATEA